MTLARLLRCTRDGHRVVVSYDGSVQLTSDGQTHTRVYRKVVKGALRPGTGMMRVEEQELEVGDPVEITETEFERYWNLAVDARGNPEFIHRPWEA